MLSKLACLQSTYKMNAEQICEANSINECSFGITGIGLMAPSRKETRLLPVGIKTCLDVKTRFERRLNTVTRNQTANLLLDCTTPTCHRSFPPGRYAPDNAAANSCNYPRACRCIMLSLICRLSVPFVRISNDLGVADTTNPRSQFQIRIEQQHCSTGRCSNLQPKPPFFL